ncbi:DUF1801 domain-containing protein [bacterium]|nr:MAG: DUF1801 domain-containing protein [bacterium]
MPNRSEAVDRFIEGLKDPLKGEVRRAREVVLATDERIVERIKWNAPSFGFGDEDRVTFRLPPKGGLQLIFHRGVKPKDATGFAFEDDSGLLHWVAKDRATLTLAGRDDVEAKAEAITGLVRRWLEATRE